MEPRTVNTTIDADGVLRLELPFTVEDADQPVQVTVRTNPKGKREWSPGFFTEVVGQWDGDLVRPEQGELREPEGWT